MRVKTTEGQEFDVRFYKKHRREKKQQVVDTACIVSTVNPTETGRDRFFQVASGEAKHNPMDRYSRVTGKKIALARALKGSMIPGQVRQLFWDQFFSEFSLSK